MTDELLVLVPNRLGTSVIPGDLHQRALDIFKNRDWIEPKNTFEAISQVSEIHRGGEIISDATWNNLRLMQKIALFVQCVYDGSYIERISSKMLEMFYEELRAACNRSVEARVASAKQSNFIGLTLYGSETDTIELVGELLYSIRQGKTVEQETLRRLYELLFCHIDNTIKFEKIYFNNNSGQRKDSPELKYLAAENILLISD